MRVLVLGACALMLAACNKDQAPTDAPGEAEAVSETLAGNDITAIDAATDDSANMAADVEMMANETSLGNEAQPGNGAANNTSGGEDE